MKHLLILTGFLMFAIACKSQKQDNKQMGGAAEASTTKYDADNMPPYFINGMGDTIKTIIKSNAVWEKELDDATFYVMREKGTERAFTSPLNKEKREGLFTCAACGLILFRSNEKFDSGTGWPSFWAAADENNIMKDTDYDIGYARTELMCARCGGHLGHVFDDGPKPTGLRYCINGLSLNFVKAEN